MPANGVVDVTSTGTGNQIFENPNGNVTVDAATQVKVP
jgi:hypothetical protein